VAPFDAAQVRRYYDRHTAAFVALGEGGHVSAIHPAVWGPGVGDRRAAVHYVEDLIADAIRRLPPSPDPPRVVDLGCGVGGSLRYLADRLPIRGTGITLSPVQAQRAARLVREAGLSDRIACIEGDFCDLPPDLAPADLAYAIESFVHAPSPVAFFEQCRQLIRPGGVLAICDDFKGAPAGTAADRTMEQFREGWHVNALLDPKELRAHAEAAAFDHISTVDLSPYLEIRRTRDRAISAFLSVLGWLAIAPASLGPLHGGRALQTCLAKGWIRYELAIFRRAG